VDPVRYLTNGSTGIMGYALAAAAAARGADVVLVSGPTALETPDGVERVDVVSADEMHAAVGRHADADLVLMAAAVADYAPDSPSDRKLKKSDDALELHLRRTPDVLAGLGKQKRDGQTLVGFALETHDGPDHARAKLARKNLDWIVLNHANEAGAGFGPGTNRVTLLGRDGQEEALPLLPKRDVAERILDRVTPSLRPADAPGR
jgi:phosphopantothenoylcysteine decarboxylase/phosphopantothenate--cysteine ligase